MAIEAPMKRILKPARLRKPNQLSPEPTGLPASELSNWKSLIEDTRQNEHIRRRSIHGYLKSRGFLQPEEITKWLYREVLNTDLDDPYLGLKETLFGHYPFRQEDAADETP